jgi:hypothetical protein
MVRAPASMIYVEIVGDDNLSAIRNGNGAVGLAFLVETMKIACLF